MGGGGARAAYQAGVLSGLARLRPDLEPPFLTGISAGAINAAHLANSISPFPKTAADLVALWESLECSDVFEVDTPALMWRALRVAGRMVIGARQGSTPVQGLVSTAPLVDTLKRALGSADGRLQGVQSNLQAGRLRAVALTATRYNTGQTVTFFQGALGAGIEAWERPNRRSRSAELTVDHIMASSALPLLFPAIKVGADWYGDGGIRMVAPLAPALHLGADRILAISTRYGRSGVEADQPNFAGPPSPAQVLGVLYNATFLDALDQDAVQLGRLSALLDQLPRDQRGDLRTTRVLVVRPSRDLGALANEFESELPTLFRFLTRRLGTRRARSQDLLSTVMFQPGYTRRLIELGEEDAERRRDELLEFLS